MTKNATTRTTLGTRLAGWLRGGAAHVARAVLNPVVVKEMRARMRGPRAFWLLTGYLTTLGLLAYGLFRIVLASMERQIGPGMAPQSAMIGQILFTGLAIIELLAVCFVTPALTAGTISGELERRTYDMLMATPLRPARVLIGKAFASLTYANLLILASIPLSSIIFLFGGVALRDVVQAIGLMVLVTVTYGMIGVFFSALIRHTGWAMILSYATILVITVGTLFLWLVLLAINEGRTPSWTLLYLNPFAALISAISAPGTTGVRGFSGPIMELLFALSRGDPLSQALNRPLWQYTVALYLAITVVLYAVATHLVRPVRRWRFTTRELATLLIVLLLLEGGLWVTFTTGFGAGQQPDQLQVVPTPAPVMPETIERRVIIEREVAPPVDPPPAPAATPTPAQSAPEKEGP
jgi:ABC-type transport system involved in multi-copper enzyme maturation permease subunit